MSMAKAGGRPRHHWDAERTSGAGETKLFFRERNIHWEEAGQAKGVRQIKYGGKSGFQAGVEIEQKCVLINNG